MTAELRVLGAVAAYVDGEPVDLGPLRQRCVLAVLAVEANRVVSVDQLVDRVWGDQSGDARSSLYSYLTRLRQALAVLITAVGGTAGIGKPISWFSTYGYRSVTSNARIRTARLRGLPALVSGQCSPVSALTTSGHC